MTYWFKTHRKVNPTELHLLHLHPASNKTLGETTSRNHNFTEKLVRNAVPIKEGTKEAIPTRGYSAWNKH